MGLCGGAFVGSRILKKRSLNPKGPTTQTEDCPILPLEFLAGPAAKLRREV